MTQDEIVEAGGLAREWTERQRKQPSARRSEHAQTSGNTVD